MQYKFGDWNQSLLVKVKSKLVEGIARAHCCYRKKRDKIYKKSIDFVNLVPGERRDLNPRVAESQSAALPLGYARQFFSY